MGPPVPGIRSAPQGPHVGAGPDRSFSTFAPNSLPVPRRLVNVHSSPQGTDFTARYAAIGNVRAPGSVSVPVTSPCVPLSLRPFAALVPSYSLPITLRRWALFGCTVAMEENSSVVPWGPMTRRLITAPACSPTRVSITASSRSPSPPGPLASRGAAPPHPFRCGSSWALRLLQHLCRYEEGTPYYPPSRLALPAPTAGWCRRLPLEPPASGHAGRSAPPPDTLKGRRRGRSLPPGSAPVCSRGRPRSATPSCNAPTGRDFSRGHGRPLLSHRLTRPRPGPRTFTSRRLLPSPAGPATAQREAADAVVRPGLSSPEPSRRPISAPGSLRRHQRDTLSPSPLL
ncbi:hypothetical protein NDU88_006716 [Pleurodeles waltl]|uniref:Uncharacterized protein n=1 Tax=Pleurodeles waltl TaxID=8319 RepID=A0AAV7VQN4_PLEWA|nr:hypothetical protein NDU88_006716 [Pleurodeles waltl]